MFMLNIKKIRISCETENLIVEVYFIYKKYDV